LISFNNTQIAFKHKTNQELNKAYLLFKMVASPALVSFGKVATNIALGINLPIKGLIKKTIFAQFCGGESIKDCNATISQLEKSKIGTILDYSVEGKESDAEFDATLNEILATVAASKNNESIPFCVFKVTGISKFSVLEKISEGKDVSVECLTDFEETRKRVDKICKSAFESNTPVFIDAEETWVQPAIDLLADEMMSKYNKNSAIVYNTVQLYRWDRLEFLKQSHQKAMQNNYFLGLKIVRGAYMEKERKRALELNYASPIQADKNATDKDFNLAVNYCVEHIDKIAFCAGTHNEQSSADLAALLDKKGILKSNKHIYFAQLLGMSDHISYNLSDAGYNVAKYVPYGPVKEVLPYLLRRADENTSVAGQTTRELSLIMTERKRRRIS
jgi:proline dehydrogenase